MVNQSLTRKLRIYNVGKENLFNKWCWENWISISKRTKLESYLIPCTKINLKWIKNLNVRPETVNFLEENIGKRLHDIGLGINLIDMTAKAQATKTNKKTTNKWDYIKLKSFCTAKETIRRLKRQPTEWEKIYILQAIYFIKG